MQLTPLRRALGALLLLVLTTTGLTTISPAPALAAPILGSTTTVAASPFSTSIVGRAVTLTATVKISLVSGLGLLPSGTVTFTSTGEGGPVQVGAAPVKTGCLLGLAQLGSCTATITTSALPVGTNTVTASYSGDAVIKPSVGTTQVRVLAAAEAPAPPTLTATSEVGDVRLSWVPGFDGGSPVTSYRLYRSTSATGPFTQIAEVPTGNYQDTTAATGVTYYYQATSINTIGESARSNTASGSPTALSSTSYDTTTCDAGTACNSKQISASATGTTTTLQIQAGTSAGSRTLTSSLGGPALTSCTTGYKGFSATFNDTATDAPKQVRLFFTGTDATANVNSTNGSPRPRIGCLGLGTPWKTGPGAGDNATWSAADGLYVGTPAYCSEMDAFYDPVNSYYTQPCASVYGGTNPDNPTAPVTFGYDLNLPPGDGRMSGTR